MIRVMRKLSSIISAAAASAMLYVTPVFAQAKQKVELCPKDSEFNVLCNLQYANLGKYIGTIISIILGIAVIIALFFLIYGGIKWILSGGDKGGVEAARNTIVAAIVGLVITFLAFLIINIVGGLFNINLLNFTFPSLNLTATP